MLCRRDVVSNKWIALHLPMLRNARLLSTSYSQDHIMAIGDRVPSIPLKVRDDSPMPKSGYVYREASSLFVGEN